MPVQYSVIIKMGCGKKIAAAVHIDIIVFYFSKQYNEDKKGVCFYEVSEICREKVQQTLRLEIAVLSER